MKALFFDLDGTLLDSGKKIPASAVEALLELFRGLGKRDRVEIQVHETNSAAIRVYEKTGFETIGRAEWNRHFFVMGKTL